MAEEIDHPFEEVAHQADMLIDGGATVYFKFTCEYCGTRQTFEEPNRLYTRGSCEMCGLVTDLRVKGCNYLVIWSKL
jgi:hypothetical protein